MYMKDLSNRLEACSGTSSAATPSSSGAPAQDSHGDIRRQGSQVLHELLMTCLLRQHYDYAKQLVSLLRKCPCVDEPGEKGRAQTLMRWLMCCRDWHAHQLTHNLCCFCRCWYLCGAAAGSHQQRERDILQSSCC